MSKVYTARYSNKNLLKGDYTTVRISVGTPRWNKGYRLDDKIDELMPFGLFGKYDILEEFTPRYYERLDEVGVDKIRAKLNELLDRGKDVVLLCFEDIRKPGEWCHRRVFAEWWKERTGEEIEELPEAEELKDRKKESGQMSIL